MKQAIEMSCENVPAAILQNPENPNNGYAHKCSDPFSNRA